jgi:pSer/pThr/pTyr-binding forkhead associated (FHA) protein
MAKLILKRKAEVLVEYPLKGDNFILTVGSEPGNDVVVHDKLVSMTHFQVERQGSQYFVRDLKSAYGTYVNGTRISQVTEIHDGDVIQIGEHTVVFKEPAVANAVPGNNNSSLGHSLSSFLNEVKDAVINPGAENAAKPPAPNATGSPYAGAVNESPVRQSAGDDLRGKNELRTDGHNSTGYLDVEAIEGEYSEILGSSSEAENVEPPPRSTGGEEKSPYYLLAIYGPYLGKKYQLNFGETKIGRDSKLNDIVIRHNKKKATDHSISRRHATITYVDGGFRITDKRSQSRTFVNQHKLSETDEVRLLPGDEIEIVSDQQSTIFRFVAEGNWDFSPPLLAGEWWLRYRSRALNPATIAVVVIGLLVNLMAWRGRAIVTDVPNPFAVESKAFTKIETTRSEDKASASPSSRAQNVMPLPALAEINGDDNVDIVVIQPSGIMTAVDGKTRRRLWEANNLVLNRTSPPVAADLNENDMADLVALTADGHLVAIDGLHGAEIWMSPFFENEMIGPPIIADFNGDRHLDVAIIDVEGKLNVGYSRVFSMEWVGIDIGLPCGAPLSAGDLNGDGDDEILVGTERGIVLIYDGVERRMTASIDVNEELNKLKGSFYEDNQIRHPIGLADLNGDKALDIIISSMQGNLLCIGLAGKPEQQGNFSYNLWWANMASGRQRASDFSCPFALADLDIDGLPDVVALADDGRIMAFRGRGTSGQRQPEFWKTKPDTLGWLSAPRLCDFNKDGAADIVVINEKRELKIFNGKTGELFWQDDESILGATSMPLLADLLDDTSLDIVLLAVDGLVYDFKTNRRLPGGGIIWGQSYGTPANTSTLAAGDPGLVRYHFMLVTSSLVMAAAIAGNILVRQRRRRFAKPQM